MTNEEFLELFHEDLFIAELRAQTKEDVLREFVDLLHRAGRISDPQIVLEMLLRRENLGSTALGKGVAIPHGRTLTTRKLILAYGRCTPGILFDAPDGKPVHLIFVIIAPYQDRNNLYLPALGKIAEFFRKKKLRERLLQANNFQEFMDVLSSEANSQ